MNDDDIATVDARLRTAADLFSERNRAYGNSYLTYGRIMESLFPDGLSLANHDDFGRFALLDLMVVKFARYCRNFVKGGHPDSLADLAVYTKMLEELDERIIHRRDTQRAGESDSQQAEA